MPVIARDAVASDHLVYAWPFPIGPEEYEVSCADDEQVVMCPAWMVGDRLGPGRHRWRSPDPTRPVSAYFVLVAPVEVSFDATTSFVVPATGQPVRLRANGSLQVRCADPGLLVAQFVGLPFDHVNEGVLRSVTRSVERMLSRLLTRRVVMGNTPQAVTDPSMLGGIVEELIAYNPAAGAVFGIELMRMGHLSIQADDGSQSWQAMPNGADWSGGHPQAAGAHLHGANGGSYRHPSNPPAHPDIPLLETVRATRTPPIPMRAVGPALSEASGEIVPRSKPPVGPRTQASGEIVSRPAPEPPAAPPPHRVLTTPTPGAVSPETPSVVADVAPIVPPIAPRPKTPTAPRAKTPTTPRAHTPSAPPPLGARPIPPIPKLPPKPAQEIAAVELTLEDITEPGVEVTKLPGHPGSAPSTPSAPLPSPAAAPQGILGIGMGAIGQGTPAPAPAPAAVKSTATASSGGASGEIMKKIGPGARVLVAGPDGLMQSATVRQLLQGYYELEVGGSGETIWVPMAGVVPE